MIKRDYTQEEILQVIENAKESDWVKKEHLSNYPVFYGFDEEDPVDIFHASTMRKGVAVYMNGLFRAIVHRSRPDQMLRIPSYSAAPLVFTNGKREFFFKFVNFLHGKDGVDSIKGLWTKQSGAAELLRCASGALGAARPLVRHVDFSDSMQAYWAPRKYELARQYEEWLTKQL